MRVPPRRGFPKEPGRDQNTPLMKRMIQENFWICGQRSPNRTRMQERSPRGARAEPERSRGLRKNGQKQKRSPERSPSGARTEKGLRKEYGTPKERSRSRTYIVPKPQNLPSFLGDSMLLQLIRLLLVCLSMWGPVRSLYARPTPSR